MTSQLINFCVLMLPGARVQDLGTHTFKNSDISPKHFPGRHKLIKIHYCYLTITTDYNC